MPIDRKEVEHYQKHWREISVHPTRKVTEVKSRKKLRMLKMLEPAKKKAEAMVNKVDILE